MRRRWRKAALVIHVILPALGRMVICIRIADVKLYVFDMCDSVVSCKVVEGR